MGTQRKRKKGHHIRYKAICGEPNCGFRTRSRAKQTAHQVKHGHSFRTQIRSA